MNSQHSQLERGKMGAAEDKWAMGSCPMTTDNTLLTGYETRTWEWKMDVRIDALGAVITLSNAFTVSITSI